MTSGVTSGVSNLSSGVKDISSGLTTGVKDISSGLQTGVVNLFKKKDPASKIKFNPDENDFSPQTLQEDNPYSSGGSNENSGAQPPKKEEAKI